MYSPVLYFSFKFVHLTVCSIFGQIVAPIATLQYVQNAKSENMQNLTDRADPIVIL